MQTCSLQAWAAGEAAENARTAVREPQARWQVSTNVDAGRKPGTGDSGGPLVTFSGQDTGGSIRRRPLHRRGKKFFFLKKKKTERGKKKFEKIKK